MTLMKKQCERFEEMRKYAKGSKNGEGALTHSSPAPSRPAQPSHPSADLFNTEKTDFF